jgi:hypothetical protein
MTLKEEDVFEQEQRGKWTVAVYDEMSGLKRRFKGQRLFQREMTRTREAQRERAKYLHTLANMTARELALGKPGQVVLEARELVFLVRSVSCLDHLLRFRVVEAVGTVSEELRAAIQNARRVTRQEFIGLRPLEEDLNSPTACETRAVRQLIRTGVLAALKAQPKT